MEREPWRAAAVHQLGDLVPVDVIGGGLGQQPRDPEPDELCHPPLVHQQILVVGEAEAWVAGPVILIGRCGNSG
jgi:hypothetical protein